MSHFLIQHGLLGLVRLLTTAVAAGWVGAPMSWSPDGRWLSYTMAPDPSPADRRPGWLFDHPSGNPPVAPAPGHGDVRGEVVPGPSAAPGAFRIWASRRDGGTSALIEESEWPLTSPSWSPRGHSLAYGRFVPDPMGTQTPATRGRLEVIVQDGLERKRTLVSLPGFELDDEMRARFPETGPSWSPDGQFLAISRPGAIPAVAIIRVESRRTVQTLEGALLPSWSPDGARLAFLQQDETGAWILRIAERQGQAFGGYRAVRRVGNVPARVGWGGDGRSILAVVEGSKTHALDLILMRISPDSREESPIFALVPETQRRMNPFRGLAIDFGRNEDLCFFSADLEGHEADICWSIPREQRPYRRFYPLDPSLRVGSLAIAPDERAVAMRFGRPGALSPPAVCELEMDHVPPTEGSATLIVPDESARRAWIGLLSRTARSLLAIALTPVEVDGHPLRRPTMLPLPDEVPSSPHIRARFARLGRYGSALSSARRRPESAPAADGPDGELDLEDRLFFDYLRGDYPAATAALEALEARTESRDRRLAMLSLRAQILWSQGDTDGAREVAGYLVEASGGSVYRVEETPEGRRLIPEGGSSREWARYLAQRVRQPRPAPEATSENHLGEPVDSFLNNPPAPLGPPGFELPRGLGPGEAMPFVPNLRDPQAEALIRGELQRLQRQIQRQRIQPPPPPRPMEGRPR